MHVTRERAAVSRGGRGTGRWVGIKAWWKSRRRKRGGKRPNSFLSVVRFNFPRFASEPFNALQPAPLPIHFLVPFPISAAIKGPFSYLRRDRPRIDTFDISTESRGESCRNEASEARLLLNAASIYVPIVSSNGKKTENKIALQRPFCGIIVTQRPRYIKYQ